MGPKSLFRLDDRLMKLSAQRDALEVLERRTVDFECFREWLTKGWRMGMGKGADARL